jgi:hypothetical protein
MLAEKPRNLKGFGIYRSKYRSDDIYCLDWNSVPAEDKNKSKPNNVDKTFLVLYYRHASEIPRQFDDCDCYIWSPNRKVWETYINGKNYKVKDVREKYGEP